MFLLQNEEQRTNSLPTLNMMCILALSTTHFCAEQHLRHPIMNALLENHLLAYTALPKSLLYIFFFKNKFAMNKSDHNHEECPDATNGQKLEKGHS